MYFVQFIDVQLLCDDTWDFISPLCFNFYTPMIVFKSEQSFHKFFSYADCW